MLATNAATYDMFRCSSRTALKIGGTATRRKYGWTAAGHAIFRQCRNIEVVYKPDVLHLNI